MVTVDDPLTHEYCVITSHIFIFLTQNGVTPVHVATLNERSDIVDTLVRNGADINLTYKA